MVIDIKNISICYLCGQVLDGKVNDDHVPPKQLYGHEIRRVHNPNLYVLPTHIACNESYRIDEDYFVHSLAPLTLGSYSGNSVIDDIKRRFSEGRRIPLGHKVLKEFERNPSGLILPRDKVVKRFDGKRVRRILWKIIRGLYFKEYGEFMPEGTFFSWEITGPWYQPPAIFEAIRNLPSKGDYPGVLDYKYARYPEFDNANLWGLIFWDRLITLGIFHNANCKCPTCEKRKGPDLDMAGSGAG